MKKTYCLALGLVMMFAFSVFSQEALKNTNMSLGLDLPLIGWTKHNDNGEITKLIGINPLLGISVKSYFHPVKYDSFNPYWSYGTIIVLIPYVGIGGDYVWKNGFYAGIGTIYIAPEVHLGFMF